MADDNLIRETTEITGWSQAELARRIGVSRFTVQDWIQGRSGPRRGVYTDLHREITQMQQKLDDLAERLKALS